MYDSGKYWREGLFQKEIDLNMALIVEVWKKYGHHKSSEDWYLSQEISRRTKNMSKIYAEVREARQKCLWQSDDFEFLHTYMEKRQTR
ncbi:DUF4434 domain-containing protein [Bacteroides thetaiotaomicron]|uniref:DUF4434 domain-containing protein n=1 Tax=Bacteroides thetaiotaomicron TaxID=818 RepID=UPI002166661A|nr:DUF4434 domain-containing protein [Bacteroides thetaiotaomicron]MCS2191283.1 DUF4434 domain-containing protein [Bacteroides thetaiotaomicron]